MAEERESQHQAEALRVAAEEEERRLEAEAAAKAAVSKERERQHQADADAEAEAATRKASAAEEEERRLEEGAAAKAAAEERERQHQAEAEAEALRVAAEEEERRLEAEAAAKAAVVEKAAANVEAAAAAEAERVRLEKLRQEAEAAALSPAASTAETKLAQGKAGESPQPPAPQSIAWTAAYDYAANARDEVSFVDGDRFVDISLPRKLKGGWLVVTVVRTGEVGLAPANYMTCWQGAAQPQAAANERSRPGAADTPTNAVGQAEMLYAVDQVVQAIEDDVRKYEEVEGRVLVGSLEAAERLAWRVEQAEEDTRAKKAAEYKAELEEIGRKTAVGATSWTAAYDYAAREADEISFSEGDVFVNVALVPSDGWLAATLLRNGHRGTVPANHLVCKIG